MDNALDARDTALDASTDGKCWIQEISTDGFLIRDNGPGFDPEVVADLFSIGRPLKSTKHFRLPTRGALGNGLRVVAGAVLATGGSLKITTRGQTMKLTPLDNGTTSKEVIEYKGNGNGSLIEVHLGQDAGKVNLQWANMALQLSSGEQQYYNGKTSPWWYTSRDFHQLCLAAKDRTIRELVKEFEGCSSDSKAGIITYGFKDKQATDITLEDAKILLTKMQAVSEPVKPERLGCIGDLDKPNYVKAPGTFQLDSNNEKVTIPYIIEAWTEFSERATISINVNRTPITGEVFAGYIKPDLRLSGCNLSEGDTVYPLNIGKNPVNVLLNIITPFMPIISSGKSPDLKYLKSGIVYAIDKSVKKAKRNAPIDKHRSQITIIRENISDAILMAGGGNHRFSLRQLYYVIRPFINTELHKELEYGYFCEVIANYERENGEDIPNMYRDDRGTIYHPHLDEKIALGTRMVESYKPPEWTFNKVLYIEKEGFFQILRDEKWPERHDCALMTAKGYSSRAAKDLLDLLGDGEQELLFFCVHDADASGTMIYQTLQEETKARPSRKFKIINLGLEPEEGLAMGLEPEIVKQERNKRSELIIKPVADYVSPKCKDWLQTHRIELNAMSTPQFLQWLDDKMEEHGQGKLIASADVMATELHDRTREILKQTLINKILKEINIDELVDSKYEKLTPILNETTNALTTSVREALEKNPTQSWRDPILKVAEDVVASSSP